MLCTLSKIYERLISDQLSEYFSHNFHNFLSAFRPSYGCQTTLLRSVEDWKEALDKDVYVGAILMDLSKAFDCLPHDLLIAKLEAYGVSQGSCKLLESYLGQRHQRVKIGEFFSTWSTIINGVPQGSILGPLLFNVFMNDIFYFIKHCSMYNYADDNTLSYCHKIFEILKSVLQQESTILLDWFGDNQMQANPDKFQAISVGKKTYAEMKGIQVTNVNIKCEDNVKLLGVELDYKLNFDMQITKMCKKCSTETEQISK